MTDPRQLRIYYDGACPLCRREIRFLERLDRGRQLLAFEDIARPDFDPGHTGLDPSALMARIHAMLPDGTIVDGMEVFRRAYARVGLGWLLAPTAWPLIRPVADIAYEAFARNRLRLTGRGSSCESDRCETSIRTPTDHPTRAGVGKERGE